MKCHKCGAELRSEQKVCILCGTRTAAGGNFVVDEKEPFQVTSNMKKAAGAAVLLIVVLLVAQLLRVTPPDVIAKQWFDAMAQREILKAEKFHSPAFVSRMQQGMTDTRAISDYIYDEINTRQAQSSVGKAVYSGANQATVDIAMDYPDGQKRPIQVVFTKSGRRWLIDKLIY